MEMNKGFANRRNENAPIVGEIFRQMSEKFCKKIILVYNIDIEEYAEVFQ